jgi:cytochrome c peroxidase
LRNNISLRGRSGTGHGPVHWSGNFDEIQDFEHDIRDAFGGLGFMNHADFHSGTRNQPLGEAKAGVNPELDALAAYVESLSVVPRSPYRAADGSLTPEGQAGKRIFRRLDCTTCHTGSMFTDSALGVFHDVGTLKPTSGKRLGGLLAGLDTPTLKGLWATAPYLHDGSAATLLEVIDNPNHGNASTLRPSDKDALIAYLLQLDEHERGHVELQPPLTLRLVK